MFEPLDIEARLLETIRDSEANHATVAGLYRQAICCPEGAIDWPHVNHSIMVRWGRSGLALVKQIAWQYDVHPRHPQ